MLSPRLAILTMSRSGVDQSSKQDFIKVILTKNKERSKEDKK